VDAPLYPPMIAYEEPGLVPGQAGVESITIGELLAAPATRKILLAEPVLAKLLADPPFRHHLYNFTLGDLARIVPVITREMIARVDRQIRALPASEQPQL
jgi:hypothetical protein